MYSLVLDLSKIKVAKIRELLAKSYSYKELEITITKPDNSREMLDLVQDFHRGYDIEHESSALRGVFNLIPRYAYNVKRLILESFTWNCFELCITPCRQNSTRIEYVEIRGLLSLPDYDEWAIFCDNLRDLILGGKGHLKEINFVQTPRDKITVKDVWLLAKRIADWVNDDDKKYIQISVDGKPVQAQPLARGAEIKEVPMASLSASLSAGYSAKPALLPVDPTYLMLPRPSVGGARPMQASFLPLPFFNIPGLPQLISQASMQWETRISCCST